MTRRCARTLVAAATLTVVVGCGPDGPLQVDTIQLGRSLNPDNSIASHASSFKPGDTVYVSVITSAPGAGTIRVRWIYHGSVVDEPQRQVSYREAAATSFQLNNVQPGAYSVEAFVDGKPAGSRTFRVD